MTTNPYDLDAYQPETYNAFSDPVIWVFLGAMLIAIAFGTFMQHRQQSMAERQAKALERIATALEKRP